jgi:hypothetical protein
MNTMCLQGAQLQPVTPHGAHYCRYELITTEFKCLGILCDRGTFLLTENFSRKFEYITSMHSGIREPNKNNKLRGFSPQANYTD